MVVELYRAVVVVDDYHAAVSHLHMCNITCVTTAFGSLCYPYKQQPGKQGSEKIAVFHFAPILLVNRHIETAVCAAVSLPDSFINAVDSASSLDSHVAGGTVLQELGRPQTVT